MRLLDFLLREAAKFLELADRTASNGRHWLLSCSAVSIACVSLAFLVPNILLLFLFVFIIVVTIVTVVIFKFSGREVKLVI